MHSPLKKYSSNILMSFVFVIIVEHHKVHVCSCTFRLQQNVNFFSVCVCGHHQPSLGASLMVFIELTNPVRQGRECCTAERGGTGREASAQPFFWQDLFMMRPNKG